MDSKRLEFRHRFGRMCLDPVGDREDAEHDIVRCQDGDAPACGFVQATEGITRASPEATARIVEGLITGVGFIGGGAILKIGDSVRGTATAASLWATGAIGAAVGLGSYDVAVTVAIFTIATLQFLSPFKTEGEAKDEKKDATQSTGAKTGEPTKL